MSTLAGEKWTFFFRKPYTLWGFCALSSSLNYLDYQPSYIHMRINILHYPIPSHAKPPMLYLSKFSLDIFAHKTEKIKISFWFWNEILLIWRFGLTRQILHQEAIPIRGNCVNITESRLQEWQCENEYPTGSDSARITISLTLLFTSTLEEND